MRHKYVTQAIVLQRTPLGEANALLTLLTEEVGLVRARVQGIRRPYAKLVQMLPTFAESRVILVRGKEGWRISGAILTRNWFRELPAPVRGRSARLSALLLRLVPGETADPRVFSALRDFFEGLVLLPPDAHDAAECLAALRLLYALGLDVGELPPDTEMLPNIKAHRMEYIARINRGIAASGL